MSRWSRLFLSAVIGAVAVYYFLPAGEQSSVYDVIGLAAAAAMLLGVWWSRPEPAAAWTLLGLGVLSNAVGNVVFGESEPVPSPADMLYLSAYPLLLLGILGIAPWSQKEQSTAVGAIAYAAAAAILGWLFLVVPAGHQHGDAGVVTRVVALGYPVMDLALLIVLLWVASHPGAPVGPMRLFGVGLVLMLAADAGYAIEDFGMQYALGGWVDACWLLSYGLFGAALLHPSLRSRPAVAVAREPAPDRRSEGATHALRYGVVVRSCGAIMAALGAIAFLLGAAWGAGEVVVLAGGYAVTGVFMSIAGSVRTSSWRTAPRARAAMASSARARAGV